MRKQGLMGGWCAILLLLVGSMVGPASVGAQSTPTEPVDATTAAAAAQIDVNDLRLRLGIIADDSMRGRATPSPGLQKTAEYVASQFDSFGLRPGNGESWFQEYPLTTMRAGPESAHMVALTGPNGSWQLEFGEDYLASYEAKISEGSGELFLLTTGGERPDVTGKTVIMRITMANLRQVFGGGLADLIEGEPSAFLLSLDVPDDFMNRLRGFLGGERMQVGVVAETAAPVVYLVHSRLSEQVAAVFSGDESTDGWSARIRTEAVVDTKTAPNTIGILEGSDPELRDEYVIFTAHMDHIGVSKDVEGDSINNGADDDGSGTVTVIELAQAFASLETRPRRSLVFMTVSGEERGLLGSEWYSEHPTLPLEQTVANLNIDMIGRNWQDTIVAIGKEESTLGPLVESIAASHPELDMQVIDDLWPEESFYTRSDHFNFARKGVPILFFFSGVHEDYHQVSDEVEKIGYDKMARIGRLIFYLGLEIANADERPTWDADAYARIVE
jgi:hypothetical protein